MMDCGCNSITGLYDDSPDQNLETCVARKWGKMKEERGVGYEANTVMRRIKTFRSTSDRIYDGGAIGL